MARTGDEERSNMTIVKYGDTVLLSSREAGLGFISCSHSLSPQVRSDVLLEGVTLPPQVMDCRFEIHTRSSYTERDNFMAVLRQCGIKATDDDNDFDDQVFMTGTFEDVAGVMERMQLDAARKSKIKRGKSDYEKEQAVNASELNRFMGTHLLYGQAIQLKHISTGLYISVKKTASEVDRGALKLQLTDGNQAACFIITSGLRTASDGEFVKFGDSVSLMSSMFPGMGLHQSALPITQSRMLSVKPSECTRQTMEVSCAPTVGRFQVVPYALARTLLPKESNHLKGCSAVQLARRAAGRLLVCDEGTVALEGESVTLPTSPQTGSTPPGHAVWSLQPAELEWAGMPCRFRRRYRLLHMLSDTYLAATPSTSDLGHRVHVTANYADPATIWIVHSLGQQVRQCLGYCYSL